MFEINILTPAQFGAFFPWMVVNHGPLSVLVHPQTGDGLKEHTEVRVLAVMAWFMMLTQAVGDMARQKA